MTAGGGSFGCVFWIFHFLISEPSKQIRVFPCAPQSGNKTGTWMQGTRWFRVWARWHGSVSCCWALVYCCFLPFPRLEARPSPELIGLWSRVNSRAHPAWQLPPGHSRQQDRGYCQSFPSPKDHPWKHTYLKFQTAGLPLRCGGFLSCKNLRELLLLILIYLWFSCLCWGRGEEIQTCFIHEVMSLCSCWFIRW